MLDIRVAAVMQTLDSQVLIDAGQIVGVVLQPLVGLGHNALTGATDSHYGQAELFSHSERARVQRIGKFRVTLGEHASAITGGAGKLLKLKVKLRRDGCEGLVKLRCAAPGNAACIKSEFHASPPASRISA